MVDAHFRENWSIEQYVSALGTTPHLLSKACRQAYGLSVNAFIDERRLLEVKRLLLFTMRSVEGVAHEIGFRDPAYFSRFFHGRASMPLGEWRNEQRKQSA
ncbi:helix-turn-helix domain-containing protein [Rhizobium sp.]|uniref:helix-turn-helix domain-containing protein n=1 Tax=Rhizobium sp. TaxID=391 RepID=UPI002AA8E0A0